jgi:hypothetical protein
VPAVSRYFALDHEPDDDDTDDDDTDQGDSPEVQRP